MNMPKADEGNNDNRNYIKINYNDNNVSLI